MALFYTLKKKKKQYRQLADIWIEIQSFSTILTNGKSVGITAVWVFPPQKKSHIQILPLASVQKVGETMGSTL